jgi:hypothetical protein
MTACVHTVSRANSKRQGEVVGGMGILIIEARSDSNHSIRDSSSIDNNSKRASMKSHLKGRKEEGIRIIGLKMAESFILSMVGIKIF